MLAIGRIGIALAVLATKAVLARYSNDLFVLRFVMSPLTVGAAGVAVVAVLFLACGPPFARRA